MDSGTDSVRSLTDGLIVWNSVGDLRVKSKLKQPCSQDDTGDAVAQGVRDHAL